MWKQIVGSALLLLCACAIVDRLNCKVPLSVFALYMGFLIMGLGISFSMNCGVPVNPARDLSPRLFTYLVGWGPQVFRYARVSYSKNMLHMHEILTLTIQLRQLDVVLDPSCDSALRCNPWSLHLHHFYRSSLAGMNALISPLNFYVNVIQNVFWVCLIYVQAFQSINKCALCRTNRTCILFTQ